MTYTYNDGGRAESGRKGQTGDCVARAVAIASDRPYSEVYERLAKGNATQRKSPGYKTHRGNRGKNTASHGIATTRKWFKDYMTQLGFVWTPTMTIGSGCTIHVRADELPSGNLVLMRSGHCAAMINGVLNDTYDCSREGTRCVYGYWRLA
mgnify:FL=1